MRVRLSLATALIASFALLGACAQEPEAVALQDDTPPPAMEVQEVAPLAGAPTATSQLAARQAADDAWLARLEAKGLIAERKMDPDTGKMIWVVSNRPVPNPVLFGGPNYRHARAAPRRARGTVAGGVYASNSAAPTAQASASAASAASPASTAAAAPAADAAAAAEAAPETTAATATSGPGVQPIPQAADVVDTKQAGFTMTPTLWGVVAAIVLALLLALFVANRPKARRPAYHANQAPPEASGGSHEAHHA
jgi:hypothetical protein